MIAQPSPARPPSAPLRLVFGRLYGSVTPPPGSAWAPAERSQLIGLLLAGDLNSWPESGFQPSDGARLCRVARRLVWHRWRLETGRLSEPPESTTGG